ncbi:MAG: class I SAM-dependent methyltransferase [Dehalococcoidia bacterium]
MSEARRGSEYERWLRRRDLHSAVIRWVMSAPGQWAVNSPLMKLPENLALRREQRWLDVGCGRGALLRLVDQRVGFETPPTGVDFSMQALGLARRDARKHGHEVRLAGGTATALPFRDRSFDLITSGYLMKHLTDEELDRFFSEVRRVLAGGGLALLWEFAPSGSARLDAWNRRVLGPRVRDPVLRNTSTLLEYAERAGFEFARDAVLRPFFFPPIPRASILVGRAPEGWPPG